MSSQRSSLSPSDFNAFLLRNCVAPSSECRTRDVLRCSHALTSQLFDDRADCHDLPASKHSMCNRDCQSVLHVRPTMDDAKSLASGDVAMSVVGMVCYLCKAFD
jgi:hypothetical protein